MSTKTKTPDEIKKKRDFKERFNNALSYVSYWIDRENITVTAKQEIKGKKRRFIASSLLEKIELDYDVERRDEFEGVKNAPNVSKLLGKALNQYLENVVFEAVESLKTDLSFDLSLSKREELRKFLKAVTGEDDEITLSVISHWIWMVKRNINGLSVENHIMPIVHGPQGFGKSKAILKLISPLNDFVGLFDLDQMIDSKMMHSTKDLFINFIDEMRQADKVDVSALKNLITTPSRSGRRAYSPMADHLPNLTSLIGATNKDIQDIIRDDTGMRRFYVIEAPARCDWDAVNTCDYDSIWRSVDESATGYLLPVCVTNSNAPGDTLAARQASYVDKHPALQWVDECDPTPTVDDPAEYVSDTQVLEEISNFMARSGIKLNLSKNALTRKLTPILGKKREVKTQVTRSFGWNLNVRRIKFSPLPIFVRETRSVLPD